MRYKETLFGLFVVMIVIFIIMPIPPFFLDFLLMLNIGLAILILLDALYSKEVLEMSLFPTLLLLTTLFRLALNISSTRLILGKGYAGKVINTFGNFVAGGSIVIGLIIFLIITLVNFLVITKGSERIAEVSARFALDAMPGKQMAIDSDLNIGLISQEEVEKRRKKIQNEANFYGSMDGASKFVKGDAITGIIITVINIIGGVTLGTIGLATGEKMTLTNALQMFAIMTIGDGLVSQIPALLISVATGILVTKVANDEEISAEMYRQLFSRVNVFIVSGVVMVALGFLTPLPFFMFVPFGTLLIFAAVSINKKKGLVSEDENASENESFYGNKAEDVTQLLAVDPILIKISPSLISLADGSLGEEVDIVNRVVVIRKLIASEYGIVVPTIRIKDDGYLNDNEYKIYINGNDVGGSEVFLDHYLAINGSEVNGDIEGIKAKEPCMGLPAVWVTKENKSSAESQGYTVVDATNVIVTHAMKVIKANLSEILTRQEVQNLINNIRDENSVLIEELVPKILSVGEIQKILGNLLEEDISLRNFVVIMECIADNALFTRDLDTLTEYVRQNLKRYLSRKYFPDGIGKVITLSPELEQKFKDSLTLQEQGKKTYLALPPDVMESVFESLKIAAHNTQVEQVEPILLVAPSLRTYVKRLTTTIFPEVIVLSFDEIEPEIEIKSIGIVNFEKKE